MRALLPLPSHLLVHPDTYGDGATACCPPSFKKGMHSEPPLGFTSHLTNENVGRINSSKYETTKYVAVTARDDSHDTLLGSRQRRRGAALKPVHFIVSDE